MRAVITTSCVVSEKADQLDRYADDAPQLTHDDTAVTTLGGGRTSLAANAGATAVPFGNVTNAKHVVLRVISGTVAVRFNSAVAAIAFTLTALPASADAISTYQKSAQPGVLRLGPLTPVTPLTAIYLSNPSGTVAAVVQSTIVGEAV